MINYEFKFGEAAMLSNYEKEKGINKYEHAFEWVSTKIKEESYHMCVLEELVGKSVAKKVHIHGLDGNIVYCPTCGIPLDYRWDCSECCKHCGQHLDWTEVDKELDD